MMNRKSVIAIAVAVILAVVALVVHRAAFAKESAAWRFTTVERGDVESTVSATGTLGAVTTVSVGTQVSGQISELLVDFNDVVKKGQLLARIDPTLQRQAVVDAQASLERARAQYLQAQRETNRNSELMSAGLVARSEFEATDSALDVARANVTSAQVALDRARQNLEYTNIYAPIDGVVVERNVDNGQTVAASLSAPQLFLIANDLAKMRILATVGEGDIASIREKQDVKFTVAALPGQTFRGNVQQVRLQSTTSENVVNYTVVVSVDNAEKKLLPGMTARVDFLTGSATDVLKVANAALRFKPADGSVKAPGADGAKSAPSDRTAARSRRGTRPAGAPRSGGSGTLYTVDDKGTLHAIRVRTGLTSGSETEVRGKELTAGMKVVAGTAPAQSASGASSPFSQNSGQQRGARPGGF
jgi:HlyD family secretion protein